MVPDPGIPETSPRGLTGSGRRGSSTYSDVGRLIPAALVLEVRFMRKINLALLALTLTLSALGSIPKAAAQPGEPICPACIIDYKCCIKGNHATCIPSSQAC